MVWLLDDPDELCRRVFGPGEFPTWQEHEESCRRTEELASRLTGRSVTAVPGCTHG